MQNMDWDNLRFFLAIAKTGSATGAASALGVNYTTVTRRLAALEDDLEVPLFDREERQWALTAAGANILAAVQSISEYAGDVRRQALKETASIGGRLRVTAVSMLVERTLLPELKAFQDLYPAIEVELIATADPLSLASREADFAFRLTETPPPRSIGSRLGVVNYGIYGSKEVYQAYQSGEQVPIISLPFDHELGSVWGAAGFANATRTLRCDSVDAGFAACRLGFGAASLPCVYADQDPDLFQLMSLQGHFSQELWLLSHADLRHTPRMRVFREFVLSQFQSILPGRQDE